MIFIVEYTNEDSVGNHLLTMEIEAVNLADAWETVEAHYPTLAVDHVSAKEYAYYGA